MRHKNTSNQHPCMNACMMRGYASTAGCVERISQGAAAPCLGSAVMMPPALLSKLIATPFTLAVPGACERCTAACVMHIPQDAPAPRLETAVIYAARTASHASACAPMPAAEALEGPETVWHHDNCRCNSPRRHSKHNFLADAQVNVRVLDELHASSIDVPNAGQGYGS